MLQIIFYENVVNENYKKLIDYFSMQSDYISLQIRAYVGEQLNITKEELIILGKDYEKKYPPFKITDEWINLKLESSRDYSRNIYEIEKRIHLLSEHIKYKYYSNEYPGYKTQTQSTIYVIEVCEKLINYLKEVDSLFGWHGDRPDDLCFYKNGKCILSSISHEEEYSIYCNSLNDIKRLDFLSGYHRILKNVNVPELKVR